MPIISPKIPSGLEELMRGLAKSVIKENPQNIYEFAAEYFENLLRERDGSVDQSYKKFATYKVYKKNKSARLKREKENSHDVNDVHSDNGCRKDESTVNIEKRQKRDSGEKSVEEFILPAATQPLLALVRAQTSFSSESEIHSSIKKESSVDVAGAPSPSGQSKDDDIANMVLDSDMEQAALKIQSTFRGHKTRKEVKDKLAFGEEINEQVEVEASDAEIKTISKSERELEDNEIVEVLQNNEASKGSVNENQIEKITSIANPEEIQSELDDDVANMVLDEEMEMAALKIQASFRGQKTRLELKKDGSQGVGDNIADSSQKQEEKLQGSGNDNEVRSEDQGAANDEDDVANMVLDEEMKQAALNIQTSFRGPKTHSELKKDGSQSGEIIAADGSRELPVVDKTVELTKKESQEIIAIGSQGTVATGSQDQEVATQGADDDDVANMVLDEEMEVAALKIQSSFRGHKVRQEMKDNLIASDVDNTESVDHLKAAQEKKSVKQLLADKVVDENIVQGNEEVSEEIEPQKLSDGEVTEDVIKAETVSETMASFMNISEVENIVEGEALEICEEIPSEQDLKAPVDENLLDTSVGELQDVGVEGLESKEEEAELKEILSEENFPKNAEGNEVTAEAEANKVEATEFDAPMNLEIDPEEAELVKEIEAALNSDEAVVDNASGSLSEAVDVTTEVDAESLAPQASDAEENLEIQKVEDVQPLKQESLQVEDESAVSNEAVEQTIDDEELAAAVNGVKIIEQSSVEKSLNEVVEQDQKSAENLSDDKTTGDLQNDEEKVLKESQIIKRSVGNDDQTALEGDVSVEKDELAVEGNESAVVDENKLQKDLSTVAEAIETSPSQEATENQFESGDVIELTQKAEININEQDGDKVTESGEEHEKLTVVQADSLGNNEQEPQSTLNELSNETETRNLDEAFDDFFYIDSTPVVEELCEKKSIADLVDDKIVESENVEKVSLVEMDHENNGESHDIRDNLEKLPSGEFEYSTLKESLSEPDVTPAESLDEFDDKSRDLTDEKSIDGDSKSSTQPSINEAQNDEQLASAGKSIESLIRSSTVDDAEANATQEKFVENLNEAKAVDSILNTEISPIELMNILDNERASAVANELFNAKVEQVNDESELEKPVKENQSTEFIEPKLNEENPLKEIEPSKSINLSQESVQQLQDEQNPINDEILQPDIEDSEIPEETPVPVYENIPTVSIEAENPSVTSVEQLPEESEEKPDREPQKTDAEDDDIANMVLDDEMEDAALKIQAAFRGHKVRKDVQPSANSQQNESAKNGAEKPETSVLIDQCNDEGQTAEQQEEAETQDTSADVEEILESEDQEETQEETHDEKNTEEETAVDSAENETAEQNEDDPEGTPEGGEASQPTEAQNDSVQELDDDVANMVLDDEMEQAALKIQSTFRGHKSRKDTKKDDNETKTEEPEEKKDESEPPKEEEPAQSSSTEKTAKQLQDEEDIAGIVMDAEMEQTALKIQSAFRGKLGRKKPKDGDESTSSSVDQTNEDETEEDTPKKSEDPFQPNEMSQEHETSGEKFYDDEKASDYSGAAHYSQNDDARYSIDRYDGSVEYEPMAATNTSTDINLMQGGGIFPEASGESSDILLLSKKSSAEMMLGSSGEDKEPNRHSSYEKVPSDKSFEIDESISQKKSVDQLNDEQVIIENFDFDKNKDTAEAMYYALKKNEIETQRQLSDKQLSVEKELTEGKQRLSLETMENQSMDYEQHGSDDDDDCVVIGAHSAKRLKYGMSMDDRLLGSILSPDYSTKDRRDIYPDDGFDPLLEASMRNQHFLEKLHEVSNSDEGQEEPYDDYPGDDEDHFDDFYHSNNIRQKIMASSISIADSDYFDPMNKSSIIDENIRTALETIHSTDSESTTITKIQAGEKAVGKRGYTITTQSMQYASFGNAAIDRSLDEFIQSQEFRIERFDEEMEATSPPPRMQESIDDWTDNATTYIDSDKKAGSGGVIEITLEQKPCFLTVDERRRTLHREDAIQRNSTREDEDTSKSLNASGEKLLAQEKIAVVTAVAPRGSVTDADVEIPMPELPAKSQPSSQSIAKQQRIKRQHTMPVQIQTDVIRVIPKHLRKRIKSAESTDKKKRTSK